MFARDDTQDFDHGGIADTSVGLATTTPVRRSIFGPWATGVGTVTVRSSSRTWEIRVDRSSCGDFPGRGGAARGRSARRESTWRGCRRRGEIGVGRYRHIKSYATPRILRGAAFAFDGSRPRARVESRGRRRSSSPKSWASPRTIALLCAHWAIATTPVIRFREPIWPVPLARGW